jgi:hypothetical protein
LVILNGVVSRPRLRALAAPGGRRSQAHPGARPAWWEAVGRHRLFLGLLVGGTLLRVVVQLAYRPALVFPDTGTYLADAWNFAHGRLVPDPIRTSGYSLFLVPLVELVHHLFLAAVANHVLGLGSAILVYALLTRLGCPRWGAALATVPVLFDPLQLDLEQYVLSDVLASFLVLAGLVVLVWRRGRATEGGPPQLGWGQSVAAGLLLSLAAWVRMADAVAILPALLYVMVAIRPWKRLVTRGGLVALSFALPLVGYAGWFHASWGPWALSSYSGHFMYGKVASFADCKGMALPSYERSLCPSTRPGHRRSADFYMWDPGSPQWKFHPPPGRSADAVVANFSTRIILHQPLTYAEHAAADFSYGFSPVRGRGPDHYPQWYHQFQSSYPTYHGVAVASLVPDILWSYGHLRGSVQPRLAAFLHAYGRWYVPGPLLASGLLVGMGAAVGLGHSRRSRLRAPCLAFSVGVVAVLLPPAALSVFDWRYQLPQLALIPVGACLGITALVRGPQPDATRASGCHHG